MRILSIDSSLGTQLLVADADLGPGAADPIDLHVLTAAQQDSPRRHAESLGPMLADALAHPAVAAAPLDAVVAATGPAPFTGLRAGLVTARALGRVRNLPVYGVPSLDAVARAALDRLAERDGGLGAPATVRVVTDARRKEVYTACYRTRGADDVERLGEYEVLAPAVLRGREDSGELRPADVVAGSGAVLYPELTAGREVLAPVSGDAAAQVRIALARLRVLSGTGEEALRAAGLGTQPLYLRRPDVQPAAGRGR
ncbi:tRNA (adenosine(37)-N6)-threonylcarbamoyltransferase complex dimerization subunit type 1 TsaB [Actinomyces sp.]|uniref:tRNA (adenosine(37)-N6)-threonylcarbamoyltransferase complex dimerization subunit type 1 TsaB n=1 Tax=Actinomyces sp. TaxID=29317 RepID=UPI0026DB70CA|nr:tRNA (adenosine(37)-N6)-threonylcarbamoyltransferase complex dimerization subunit type 1 TsaB [Actinomyces sp.]MDO4901756.1 tRNA (adenosine(37)-N6)-threonylcarbamoyltransferase complex dimerization subunit type 1 TsaB [Actinomyces sp.]